MNDDYYDSGRLAEFVRFFLSEDQTRFINRQCGLQLFRSAEGGTFAIPVATVDKIEGFLVAPDFVNSDACMAVDGRALYSVTLLVKSIKRRLRREQASTSTPSLSEHQCNDGGE